MKYVARIMNQLDGKGSVYFFPNILEASGQNWLSVQFHPQSADPWIGMFAQGYHSSKVLTGIFEWPDPDLCCVVSSGRGYIVEVEKHESRGEILAFPIVSTYTIPERNLVVFSDFLGLVAYARTGLIWKTPRISWDGVKLKKVTSEEINGEVWDSPCDKWVPFSINPWTGNLSGGIDNLP